MIGRKERKKGVQARMLDYSVLMFKHHRPGTDQILSFCPVYIVLEFNICFQVADIILLIAIMSTKV